MSICNLRNGSGEQVERTLHLRQNAFTIARICWMLRTWLAPSQCTGKSRR